MIRLVLSFALGVALIAGSLGCGDGKKSEPPKQEQPIIPSGPDSTGGGDPGKGKGGTGGVGTVQ